jgi:hypothetical protein
MSLPQKSSQPRFSNSCQSTNSSQKAKRPSSLKRKTSIDSSYRNSESPWSMRYVITSHRSSGRRYCAASGKCSAILLSLSSIALQRTEPFFSTLSAGVMHSREAKDTPYLPKIIAGIDRQRRDCVSTHDERSTMKEHQRTGTRRGPADTKGTA